MKKIVSITALFTLVLVGLNLAQSQAPGWSGASWIWDEANANTVTQNNEPRYLRLAFELTAKPMSAELWVTADNHYIAYVNGKKVGEDAEWATVERYDVAKHLIVGKNVLAIQAKNQGGVAGAIARLHIKTEDKKELNVVTDEKTKIIRAATVRERWTASDFDDSAWSAATVLGDPSIAPWNLGGSAVAQGGKGKAKKGGGQFGYDTNETVAVKGRLTPQEQIKHFVVPKDFEIELVAADPLVINPITMVMDDKGRIIVSESHTYRYGPPGSPIKPYANPVVRLDPDGKGGFTRVLLADGFADPVMGIAVKGDKLWLAANNYLYTYDIPETSTDRKGVGAIPAPQREEVGRAHFAPKGQQQFSPGQRPGFRQLPEIALKGQNNKDEPDLSRPFRATDPAAVLPRALPWAELLLPLRGEFQIATSYEHHDAVHGQNAFFIQGKDEKTKPLATNKKLIVTDLTKAWNPFGMFVLEWGPDGKLYMSVGNHNIKLQGPDKDQTTGRGSSGIIVRMNPDGSKMERLVHGLRVPYSFEMDPFGQLWLLSNGEGNPNRFVRVIEGVDYHCYSRGAVDNNWLAGNHPLAPPSEELHRGAHTQLMRYYGAAYPSEYWGNLFLCNWGAHGYAGPNRAINRFVTDERNNVVKREPLVWCKDPHFRPAHIIYDQDGSILIADWYGRDDESDLTGRIWRLKYVGKDAPVVKHKLDAAEWKNDEYAIEALGSPSHLIREKASNQIEVADKKAVESLKKYIETTKESVGASQAMWTLLRINTPESKKALASGLKNSDWKVRRLVWVLNNRYMLDLPYNDARTAFGPLDADPAVEIEFVKRFKSFSAERMSNYTADPHLRYEAACHLAKYADEKAITSLLTSDDADVRLAGLIAIDIACYENFPSKKAALEALGKALENPGKLDHQLLLMVAQLDGDASIVPGLLTLIARDDLPAATIAKAVLVLKAKSGGGLASAKLNAAAGKRLIEAIEKGQLKIATPADQLVMFEFLEAEGPTPFALKQVAGQLQSTNKDLRQAAHTLARRFGPKASPVAEQLWPSVFAPKTKFEDTLDYLSTIARTETKPTFDNWKKGLFHDDPFIRAETVRWWRNFKEDRDLQPRLSHNIEFLVKKDPTIREDIAAVYRHWGHDDKWLKDASLPLPERDKSALAKYALDELASMPAGDRSKRAAMGLQVFERNACTKCHTTATATTTLAPSLKGIAQQKVDYLIESVLHPSKVIKTGWEIEQIETKDGKVVTGLVKDEGKSLRVTQAMDYLKAPLVIDKASVESRSVSKISLMPEGQEVTLSRREFVDLIAYLQTLK